MRSLLPILAGVAALAGGLAAPSAAPPRDHAAIALNVLPPGQSGSLNFGSNARDQLRLYDGLTPLWDNVRPADLNRYFKPAPLGLGGERVVRVERTPRPGLRISRDRWGVPHISGKTRADVEYGAGWVTAADRGLLMNLLRGPGRISALDVPGLDAFSLVGSGLNVEPSAATEAFLAAQVGLLRQTPKGRRLIRDVDAYLAGINAYNRARGVATRPWNRNDVIATATLLGAVFGAGGGDETRRALLLSALQQRLGADRGRGVWEDLREQHDPEAPVSLPGEFPYGRPPQAGAASGSVVIDDGSFEPWGSPATTTSRRLHASNALLLSARRSATHHPLFVAGPQVGYYYPEILLELDLRGGGLDARGAAFPGISFYVLLGRGEDYAWSATSANSDVIDHFVETLCGGDDLHYLFRGECRAMTTFDGGVLRGSAGRPDRPLVFRTTVHGPVIGYATVAGRRVAIAHARSTRGRELLSALAFQDLNTNRVTSARSFVRAMNQLEFTFNWFYADERDIAMFSSGRLPIRAPGADGGLPTSGTGDFEWRGFLPLAGHAQGINPPSGAILNWNNKPGRGFAASDDNWAHGAVQRVDLLSAAVAERSTHSAATLVAAMNKAATQDLRAARVFPVLERVLRGGPAPSARADLMVLLLSAWSQQGGSRLDRDLDGRIDDPGAAILDAAWPRIVDAVMSPVLGPLAERLAKVLPRDDPANPGGSSYYGGWYGYVDKDLRALLGELVAGPFSTRFCGAGDLAACRASLWAALEAAGDELAAAQGANPAGWRADATGERIRFSGFLDDTMRWSNRPTFQQVMSFRGHRPRH